MDKTKVLVFGKNKINYDEEKYNVYYINRVIGQNNYFSYKDFSSSHTLGKDDIVLSYNITIPLDMRLLIPEIPFDILVACPTSDNLETIIDDLDSFKKKDYDLYSGAKIETEDNKIVENIKKNIKDIYDISLQMMEAGYLDLENNQKIDDWIVMFQDPFLQLFVEKYKPETSNGTMTIEDEFLDNADFRKSILQAFLKVISNFFVNNDLIDVKNLSKFKNWHDIELWKYIKENIEFL